MVGNTPALPAITWKEEKEGGRCCLRQGMQATTRLRAGRQTSVHLDLLRASRGDLLGTGRSGGEHGCTVADLDLSIVTVCRIMGRVKIELEGGGADHHSLAHPCGHGDFLVPSL